MYRLHGFWSLVGNIQTTDSKTKLGLGTFTVIHHLICWNYGTAVLQTFRNKPKFILELHEF